MVEVTYAQLLAIDIYAHQQRKDITAVIIPDKLTSVRDWAFHYCSVTSVDLPNTVTSNGNAAFLDCSSLTSIRLPDSLKTIPRSCFVHCSSITSITIPASVTVCGAYAFLNCRSLTSINIPDAALNDRTTFGISNYDGEYESFSRLYCIGSTERTLEHDSGRVFAPSTSVEGREDQT